jgi:hypothetical protein
MGVRFHSLTLFALPGTCEVAIGCLSSPATLQPLALVVSPRLGLRQCPSTLLKFGLKLMMVVFIFEDHYKKYVIWPCLFG